MAEGDRFEKAIMAGWRGAYRRARDDAAPTAEVADKLINALAKTLRKRGGVPGFGEVDNAVGEAVRRLSLQSAGAGEEATILIESFNGLDRIVRDKDGHRHTKVAVDVAKSLIVQQDALANGNDIWPTTKQLARDTCTALVRHYFFATARQNLVAESKVRDHEAARHWQQKVEDVMRPALRQIADRPTKDPDAEALRAPRRSVKLQPTSELLREGLVPNETPSRSRGV